MSTIDRSGLAATPLLGGSTSGPAPLAHPCLESLVVEVNALCKRETLKFALSVGELVIRRLYEGDVTRFRTRARKHDIALRKLATHAALAMSPSMLYACVGIYELCERIGVRSWRHVSTSHMRLVLPLTPDCQVTLLRDAEANRWPVRRLEQEVAALALAPSPRGGRRRNSALRRAVSGLRSGMAVLRDVIDDAGDNASPESTRDALQTLRHVVAACGACEAQILSRKSDARAKDLADDASSSAGDET